MSNINDHKSSPESSAVTTTLWQTMVESEEQCCHSHCEDESIFNRCEHHRYDKMSVPEAIHFRGMKQLLASMQPGTDHTDALIELKQRAHMLCSRFLGGAWKTLSVEMLRITRIKGGMSNMLFLCRLPDHHRPIKTEPDKVLLRVYFNPETESHLVAESVIFTLLSERHLGPKLYGIFSGGRLEEYIPSRPLNCPEIAIPNLSNQIAKRLALVHMLEVPIWKEPDYLCDAIDRWLHQLMHTPSAAMPFDLPSRSSVVPSSVTCVQLAQELDLLRRLIVKSTSPVVFCHNDLQEGNILLPKASSGNIRLPSMSEEQQPMLNALNPAAPRLVLIDFEYASYNFRGFDFANHFVEYTIDYGYEQNVFWAPYYEINCDQFPTVAHQERFFESYLRELKYPEQDMRREIQRMLLETSAFVPVSHLFWGVWGLLQVEVSPVGFGFAEYGRDRLALYFETKTRMAALGDATIE